MAFLSAIGYGPFIQPPTVARTSYAHPYRWTDTGQLLVRDTPFSRTRRQAQRGRACFTRRPRTFERLLDPPRPYRRSQTDNTGQRLTK